MKNNDSDAQIPELVAKAMSADYEYSLNQLKKLPLAEEILRYKLNLYFIYLVAVWTSWKQLRLSEEILGCVVSSVRMGP